MFTEHTSKGIYPPLEVDLPGQFLLGRSESLAPGGWAVRRSTGWCLATHPTLPVLEIRAREGALLGWLLGYPIGPDGTLLSADSLLPFALSVRDGTSQFERALYALGGRFAAVFGLPWTPRVYLDPCGSLAVVFCPEEGIVTSNPMLIPYSEKTRSNQELISAIGDAGWYFGLTPRLGIERLLPNHVLDLSTWEASRHWPSSEDLAAMKDTAVAVSEIASILERQIAAVVSTGPAYMSLTAGRHTRMLLACARSRLDRIALFTIPLPDAQASYDLEIAQQIAARFELTCLTLTWEEPTRRDLDEYFYRTGGCMVRQERAAQASRTLRQLDPARGILHGKAASFGEAEWWSKADLRPREATCRAQLLEPYNLPPMAAVVERAEDWLRGLPTRNVVDVLGLRALEQRVACWGGPQEYGYAGTALVLSPYCHRRIVQLKLTLPVGYRWRDQLPDDLLKLRWPELLGFPFDKAFGLRGAPPLPARILRRVLRYVVS